MSTPLRPSAIHLENYLLDYLPGDHTLWITFDHAGLPKHAAEGRLGWGLQELSRNGWSVLSVKARAADWFLKPDLAAFFASAEFARIAEGKTRIVLYGLSMGGFGALAYSTMIPGSVALAISPQSTLDPAKVPWEKRFDYALGEDWTGPLGDLNTLSPAHAEAYIIYSPDNKFDGPHIARLDRFGPLTLLPLAGNAHTPGGVLTEGGFLKSLIAAVAAGPIDASIFEDLAETLESSAAYHYFQGWENPDPEARNACFQRCLELAASEKQQYYRQRIAGCLMRSAAKERDQVGAMRQYKDLRKCAAWRGSISLKLMAARYLMRVEALEPARSLLTEIKKRHPEGHRKLADLEHHLDKMALEMDREADAADAASKKVVNG
ncbi:MAG: hypothetical protein AB8B85_04300 [Paracoccaceae bacterium]